MTSISFARVLRAVLLSTGILWIASSTSSAQELRAQEGEHEKSSDSTYVHSIAPPEGVTRPENRPVRLSDIIAEIRERNPSVTAARFNAHALAQRREQASALPDPSVGVQYQPFSRLTAMDAMRSMWSVEQMIPYPGKLGLRADIADVEAEAAYHESETLAEDLILQAKTAYYELYGVQQLESIIREFEESLSGFVEVAAVQYEVGKGSQQAVLKAQVERSQLAQQLIDLREKKRSAAELLARLTNRPGGASYFRDVEVAPPPVPQFSSHDLMAVAVDRRPEMAALEAAADMARLKVELARKEFRPDFGLNVTYFDITNRNMGDASGGTDGLAFGASVNVPLQRGRLRAQLREAEIRRQEVEARREALITEFQTDIDNLLYALEQETETLGLYESALLPQASSTTEAALYAYTTGTVAFLDLLDAERTEIALRTAHEEALVRYLTTAALLERALGISSLDDIADGLTAKND